MRSGQSPVRPPYEVPSWTDLLLGRRLMAVVSELLHDAKNVEKIASVWFREGLKHRLDWMRCVEYVGDEFFSIHFEAKVRPAFRHLTEVQGEASDRNETCLSHDPSLAGGVEVPTLWRIAFLRHG